MSTPPAPQARTRTRPQRNAARWHWLALAAALAGAVGCTTPSEPALTRAASSETELVVRLVFDHSADLDLYVTDPAQETIYFANTPSRSGGGLERDVRCDDEPPRVETIRFPSPAPGLYRVGVDYPKRCGLPSGAASFRILVERGAERSEARGEIPLGHFRIKVMEFRVSR